jgi:hypothetical protein
MTLSTVPPEPDRVLSGATRRPCPDCSDPVPSSENLRSGSAPGTLPLVRLHEVLDDVVDSYAWFTRLFPRAEWATQPDPIRACQILADYRDQLERMMAFADEAHRHISLLWDLSFDESIRRRGYDYGEQASGGRRRRDSPPASR